MRDHNLRKYGNWLKRALSLEKALHTHYPWSFNSIAWFFNIIPISILKHWGQGKECISRDLINWKAAAPARLVSSALWFRLASVPSPLQQSIAANSMEVRAAERWISQTSLRKYILMCGVFDCLHQEPGVWHCKPASTSLFAQSQQVGTPHVPSSSLFLFKWETPDFPLRKLLTRRVYSVIVLEILFIYLLILILFSTTVLREKNLTQAPS